MPKIPPPSPDQSAPRSAGARDDRPATGSAARPKVRLYVEQPLDQGQHITVSHDQAHYLANVLRMQPGQEVALFNGRDGEWRGEIMELGRKRADLVARDRTLAQRDPPDLWLLFAPVKKARTDFIVEKAVELGVRRIQPVQTRFTNSERIRRDRLQAHAIEAAEQCGATFVPEVAELTPLPRLLDAWPAGRSLWWADEDLATRQEARQGADAAPAPRGDPMAAILIGPEGGFSAEERARLAALPFVRAQRLGPRILRADTAAVAAITLWQARFGDWTAPD